jgi:hypothetical protein
MPTIFSIPKPFEGHVGIIQTNAITSWKQLVPPCQIILCGDELGTREIASELGADFLPEISRNLYGTPLLDSAFLLANKHAKHDLLCYVNADIMLLHDFVGAVARISMKNWLMIGRRWDVELNKLWDFGSLDWEERLKRYVREFGTLQDPSGIDYFVFPRNSDLCELPRFAVGRPGWDNWLIYNARRRGIPVIDATQVVTAIHQNHDYHHVPQRRGESWEGPEADTNRALMGGPEFVLTILDATYILTEDEFAPPGLGKACARDSQKDDTDATWGMKLCVASIASLTPAAKSRIRWNAFNG